VLCDSGSPRSSNFRRPSVLRDERLLVSEPSSRPRSQGTSVASGSIQSNRNPTTWGAARRGAGKRRFSRGPRRVGASENPKPTRLAHDPPSRRVIVSDQTMHWSRVRLASSRFQPVGGRADPSGHAGRLWRARRTHCGAAPGRAPAWRDRFMLPRREPRSLGLASRSSPCDVASYHSVLQCFR
jgi:hypothetical protein